MAPIRTGDIITSWTFDLPAVALMCAAALAYLIGVRRVRGSGGSWPWWRTVLFIIVGLGSLAWVVDGVLGVYNRTLFWAFGVQVTLLVSIVPVALAAGDPIGLVRASRSPRADGSPNVFGRVLRVLTYPFVGPLLVLASLMAVLFSRYLHAALTHTWVMDVLYLHLLVVGLLAVLPLLGADEVLPAWCTDPMKMVVACVDGLLDAVPGICALTAGSPLGHGYYASLDRGWGPNPLHDTHLGGGLMLSVAEVVGIPMILMIFFGWARNDIRHATVVDAELEAERPTRTAPGVAQPPPLERPWWESDPRFRNPRS
ncbi:MAG TPA: cytochrome c oxidase assembly protein [Marmoricola sp.]